MDYDFFDFDSILEDFADIDESNTTTSEECSEPDTVSVEITQVIKPKKKRIRVRKPLPVAPGPKVIKNDIRLSYATMFVNVLNSCDPHLMFGLLDTFFTPDFLQSFQKSIDGKVHREHSLTVRGRAHAAQHWCTSMALVPDLVVSLGNTEVQYHTGKITSTITMNATRLYDDSLSLMNTGEEVAADMQVMMIEENPNKLFKRMKTSPVTSTNSEFERILQSIHKVVNGLCLRSDPQVLDARGTFILQTDDDKRITGMHWFADTSYC